MSKPLEGVKVIDLSSYIAGPGAARILADMGASVVKVETFTGDVHRWSASLMRDADEDFSPVFDLYNTGKESICIDIKNPEGLKTLLKLIGESDVFLTNIRAKSLKKLGLDAETLTARFPRLIYAALTGFGTKGPDADSPGFDNISFWARSGFCVDGPITTDGSFPLPVMSSVGDCFTTGFIASGITSALYGREKTGKGDIVNLSLYGTALWGLSNMLMRADPEHNGEKFPHTPWEYEPFSIHYKCADGEYIVIAIRSYEKDALPIYELTGVTDIVREKGIDSDNFYLPDSVAALGPAMWEAFAQKTSDEWIAIFKARDLVIGKLCHFTDTLNDEQALVNGFVEKYEAPDGRRCTIAKPPIKMASIPEEHTTPAHKLGQDTDAVLARFGCSPEEIAELHSCGAVK